ncbi:MAG: threonine--tRNA ligase [Anaerolineaceae bacterium]|nr:threonine--tRNA ligase [Anaerolineaceae bacterium]
MRCFIPKEAIWVEPRERSLAPGEGLFVLTRCTKSPFKNLKKQPGWRIMSTKQEEYAKSQLFRIRHSAAHVMAEAVLEMFPDGKVAIGPAIDDGFYYDFDLPRTLTPDDLATIEKRMQELIKSKEEFKVEEISADQAKKMFADQPYKIELIEGLEQGNLDDDGNPTDQKVPITIYRSGNFVDLCKGPHVESTAQINPTAIKLLNVAGAYWRGDEHRPMLQRIYGTAWESKDDLKDYLWRLEEARKRDHRKLGKELDLYSTNDEVGQGLILWHPNGGMIRHQIETFWDDQHVANDYDMVYTPHIGKASLWETSGHLGFYKENMYAPITIEDQEYYLKPMNCPFHLHIYKSQLRSYRDLPLRFAEKGTVYRYERSGVMHGLMRVRGFTQDDAHHFCRPDQMGEEVDFALNFSINMLRAFGFNDFQAYLSTMPEKSVGDEKLWHDAEAALEDTLKRVGVPYELDAGGGAFYGPKIDLKVRDALGREWQLSTIQFDFNLPERFDLTYIGEDGKEHRPLMVHRALLGSMERFFGVLIEHYGGAFPVWLSPKQVMLVPIADRHNDYAHEVAKQLKAKGLRVTVDDSSDRMNAKIRNAQKAKYPYMLVIGDREMEEGQVALRRRNGDNPGAMSVEDFIALALDEIEKKI